MSAAVSQPFIDALCFAATQAKAAYELAYESAELRNGSELQEKARGADRDATFGDVALHAITQCEWVIEQCRGMPGAIPSQPAQSPQASTSTSTIEDEMPAWLRDAAEELQPAAVAKGPARSESFRRRRRTRKTGD